MNRTKPQTGETAQILPFTSPTLLPETLAKIERYNRKRKPTKLDDADALGAVECAVWRLRDRQDDPMISFALRCAEQHLTLARRLAYAKREDGKA